MTANSILQARFDYEIGTLGLIREVFFLGPVDAVIFSMDTATEERLVDTYLQNLRHSTIDRDGSKAPLNCVF